MSEDHKPNRADERQRIEEAGGVVVWAGTWRVGGVLAGENCNGAWLALRHAMQSYAWVASGIEEAESKRH